MDQDQEATKAAPEQKKQVASIPTKVSDAAQASIEAKVTENGTEIVLTQAPQPLQAPSALIPMTDRMRSKLQAEMDTGRRAVRAAEDAKILRPQPKPDPADGHQQPVHRPGDVSEYRNMLTPNTSKDALSQPRQGFPVARG